MYTAASGPKSPHPQRRKLGRQPLCRPPPPFRLGLHPTLTPYPFPFPKRKPRNPERTGPDHTSGGHLKSKREPDHPTFTRFPKNRTDPFTPFSGPKRGLPGFSSPPGTPGGTGTLYGSPPRKPPDERTDPTARTPTQNPKTPGPGSPERNGKNPQKNPQTLFFLPPFFLPPFPRKTPRKKTPVKT